MAIFLLSDGIPPHLDPPVATPLPPFPLFSILRTTVGVWSQEGSGRQCKLMVVVPVFNCYISFVRMRYSAYVVLGFCTSFNRACCIICVDTAANYRIKKKISICKFCIEPKFSQFINMLVNVQVEEPALEPSWFYILLLNFFFFRNGVTCQSYGLVATDFRFTQMWFGNDGFLR